jgi:acetyl-CoA synthetase
MANEIDVLLQEHRSFPLRRLLSDIAEGRTLGDVTTLADPTVVASLKDKYGEES